MLKKLGSQRFKNLFWTGVATAIFVGLVWTADPSKMFEALREASLIHVGLAVVSGFLVINAWALNWYNWFLSLDVKCSYIRTFQLFSSGQFFNCVTPLGRFGGQPIMAYLISNNSDSSYEKALATVMSADLISVIPISVFITSGYLYLILNQGAGGHLAKMSTTMMALLILGMVIGYLAWFKSGTMEKYFLGSIKRFTDFIGRGSKYVDKLGEKLENWEETLHRIGNDPKALVNSIILITAAFGLRMTAFYLVLSSLGVSMDIMHIVLLVPLISVANISPTPGGAGTYEAAMAATIILLVDISFAVALTVTFLYRMATYWQALIVGYISTSTIERMPEEFRTR